MDVDVGEVGPDKVLNNVASTTKNRLSWPFFCLCGVDYATADSGLTLFTLLSQTDSQEEPKRIHISSCIINTPLVYAGCYTIK